MKISAFSKELTQSLTPISKPLLYKLLEIQKVANNFDDNKADKIDNPTVDNIAVFDADGNVKDSGKDINGTFLESLSGLTTDDLAAGSVNLYFPGFTSLSADYGFIDNSSNWNIAYGWGNHASAGYSKSDGSIDYTNIVGYSSHPAFTADTEIIDKKYVDDAIAAAGGYTDEMAQDAVGGILTDTAEIDFTYNDAAGTITANLKAGSIPLSRISATSIVIESEGIAANDNDTTFPTSAAVKDYVDSAGIGYPGAGIALSTGSSWGSSITNNSANWNTAYGWGNHASAGYLTGSTGIPVSTFTADSQVLVGTGNGTFAAQSGATLRTSLGLGTGNTPQFAGLSLTGDITAAGIKLNAATDWFGSASVPDAPALTSNEFDDQTTGTASTSYVLREYDGDWEDINDNFSTVATEFNKLRQDVSDMRLQLNDLLAQLRITGGCGVIDD